MSSSRFCYNLFPFSARVFCALALCLLLAACVSSGGYGRMSPWGGGASASASGAPSPLSGEASQKPAADPLAGTRIGGDGDRSLFMEPSAQAPQAPAPGAEILPAAPVFTPVKVGLLLPASGKNAELGQAMLKSAQLAVFDLGYPGFEIVSRDTGDSPEGAARAAREVLASGARILIGPLTAPAARAVRPVAAAAGVNMLTFSTDWTLAGKNAYVMGFLPFSQVDRVAAFAERQNMRAVAVIAPENDYGGAVVSAFSSRAPAYGLRVAGIVRVAASGADLTEKAAQLAAQSASSPFGAVLIAAGGARAREISAALSDAGLGPGRVARLGTGLWDDPVMAADGGMEGAWFAAPSPRAREAFEHKYAELYGVNPPRLATLAYDATALAAVLARTGRAGEDPFSRAALLNPNGFAGLDGIFRFRPDGLVERGDAILTFSGRRMVEAEPAPEGFQARSH